MHDTFSHFNTELSTSSYLCYSSILVTGPRQHSWHTNAESPLLRYNHSFHNLIKKMVSKCIWFKRLAVISARAVFNGANRSSKEAEAELCPEGCWPCQKTAVLREVDAGETKRGKESVRELTERKQRLKWSTERAALHKCRLRPQKNVTEWMYKTHKLQHVNM